MLQLHAGLQRQQITSQSRQRGEIKKMYLYAFICVDVFLISQ